MPIEITFFVEIERTNIMQLLHLTNVVIHIIAGSLALCLGLITAIFYKKKRRHLKFGWWFVSMMSLVVLTGLNGIFVFNRNSFLLVITLLSGYNCFSGIRAVRLKGNMPRLIDLIMPLVIIAVGGRYLYSLQSSGLYWSPVVVYSTLGALLLVTAYDLSKSLQSNTARKKTIYYEHAYKMISALSGLASAFAGTVFPQYHPYSQFLPSVLGLCWIVTIFIRLNNDSNRQRKQAISSYAPIN